MSFDYPLVERPDGTLVLNTPPDPAATLHQRLGYRRLTVGLDVGGRGEDPSAVSVIRSTAIPYLTGRGWEQALRPPQHTVVYTETARLAEATDVVDWIVATLRKLRNASFFFDATGMGAPLASMFAQAKVAATPVIMTAGANIRREGGRINVSKNLLLENLAIGLENGSLRIAHDLPERDELAREISSIEYQVTSAGNLTLRGGGRGHHADRVIASAIALLGETHGGSQSIEVRRLRGWF